MAPSFTLHYLSLDLIQSAFYTFCIWVEYRVTPSPPFDPKFPQKRIVGVGNLGRKRCYKCNTMSVDEETLLIFIVKLKMVIMNTIP
jgi:hypothetical protein